MQGLASSKTSKIRSYVFTSSVRHDQTSSVTASPSHPSPTAAPGSGLSADGAHAPRVRTTRAALAVARVILRLMRRTLPCQDGAVKHLAAAAPRVSRRTRAAGQLSPIPFQPDV